MRLITHLGGPWRGGPGIRTPRWSPCGWAPLLFASRLQQGSFRATSTALTEGPLAVAAVRLATGLSLQGQTCQEAGGGVAGSPCSSTLGIRAGAPQEGGEKPNPEREGSQDSGKGREPPSPLGLKGQRQEREALLEARISGHLGDAGSFQACL